MKHVQEYGFFHALVRRPVALLVLFVTLIVIGVIACVVAVVVEDCAHVVSWGVKSVVLLAGRNNVGRLHKLAGLVRPVVLCVGDHGGDFSVAQLLPGRHRAVVLAIQHDADLRPWPRLRPAVRSWRTCLDSGREMPRKSPFGWLGRAYCRESFSCIIRLAI